MKKTTAIIMSLIISAAFTACRDKESPSADSDSSFVVTGTAETDTADTTTVNTMLYNDIAGAVRETVKTVYPDNYGGIYYGKNDGKVHIAVSADDEEYKKIGEAYISAVKEKLGDKYVENSIVIEKAHISYEQLNNMLNAVNENMEKYSVSVAAINDETDQLDIEVLDISQKEPLIGFLKSRFDYFKEEYVNIVKGEPVELL